jgi:hypothetical protein
MTDDQPIPPPPKSESDSKNNATHPSGNATPEVEIPPSHSCYQITCNKKRDKWDIAKLVAEFFGLGFLILYTLYTAGIYCANKRAAQAAQDTFGQIQKQTTLMRQQLVGTQAAIIRLSDPVWNPATNKLKIVLTNNGSSVTGTVTSFNVDIQRKTLPAQKSVGEPIHVQLLNQVIPKGISYEIDKELPWSFPEIKDQNLWPGKQMVTFAGSYTYDDGFGDIASQNFCAIYVPFWWADTPMQGYPAGGGSWSNLRQECPPVQDFLDAFTRYKNHTGEWAPR